MDLLKLSSLILVAYLIAGCSTDASFKQKLEKTLLENPDIVLKTIEKHPTKFLMTLDRAAKTARNDMEKAAQEKSRKEFEDAFNNPLSPEISNHHVIVGPKDAPITLIEYSDFECPFCAKGYETVTELFKKYPGKIKFVYKHLPLNFHPQAMISAQYYEAIARQDQTKAKKFHDEIFKNQSKLKKGEKFLRSVAKSLKINLIQLEKDLKSSSLQENILNDIQEAKKFGMSGTPGFIVNGIPVKGAYPAEHFTQIIDKLVQEKRLKL